MGSALAQTNIKFSNALKDDEKELVKKSLQAAIEKKLNPKLLSPLYQKYFKSSDLKDIQKYLSQRIDLIVSPTAKLWVKTSAPNIPLFPILFGDNPSPTNNPGLLLWIADRWETRTNSQIDGENIASKSMPKVIQLGTDFGKYFPIFGLSILVHEARHSDCEIGLDDQTISKWKNSSNLKELSLSLGQHLCGYSHGVCPEGSINAGKTVCDSTLNGAYSYQYVFNRAIVNACKNCSFAEKIVMQVFSLDAATRIPLSPALSALVGSTLNQLPSLQKSLDSKELINNVLEKVLKQVDDFMLDTSSITKAKT